MVEVQREATGSAGGDSLCESSLLVPLGLLLVKQAAAAAALLRDSHSCTHKRTHIYNLTCTGYCEICVFEVMNPKMSAAGSPFDAVFGFSSMHLLLIRALTCI